VTLHRRRIVDAEGILELVSDWDATPDERARALPRHRVARWLARAEHDLALGGVLEELAAELRGRGVPASRWAGAQRTQVVAEALGRGEWLLVPRELPAGAQRPSPPNELRHEGDETRTWIDVTLVDESAQPVARERYRVEAPGGEVRTGSLDGDGHLREERLRPGRCRVSFPDLDADALERRPASTQPDRRSRNGGLRDVSLDDLRAGLELGTGREWGLRVASALLEIAVFTAGRSDLPREAALVVCDGEGEEVRRIAASDGVSANGMLWFRVDVRTVAGAVDVFWTDGIESQHVLDRCDPREVLRSLTGGEVDAAHRVLGKGQRQLPPPRGTATGTS
jgi:hypothetical protein